jgi:hypothetical protein
MTLSQNPDSDRATSHEREYLEMAFSPSSGPLRSRWRNNGLSADFLGDYVATFMPSSNDGGAVLEKQQSRIKHAVAYIANELLENAMKYHQRDVDIPVRIDLELTGDHITVSVSNGASQSQAQSYAIFVEQLRAGDASELFLQQQEKSAKCDEAEGSCVGLLTMIIDYDALMDWRFEIHPVQQESMIVTTSAVLLLDNILGAST